jgi:hypothetical protein
MKYGTVTRVRHIRASRVPLLSLRRELLVGRHHGLRWVASLRHWLSPRASGKQIFAFASASLLVPPSGDSERQSGHAISWVDRFDQSSRIARTQYIDETLCS